MVLKEAEILKKLRHPNLVESDGYIREEFDGSSCLLMILEYFPVNFNFIKDNFMDNVLKKNDKFYKIGR